MSQHETPDPAVASSPSDATAMVSELELDRARRELVVRYDDGVTFTFPAEMLRVMSPSAEVQGHGPDQRVTVPGKRHVGIRDLEPVGNYAVRILFDDGHDTGLFSWAFLRRLGDEADSRWATYLKALEREWLSRDP